MLQRFTLFSLVLLALSFGICRGDALQRMTPAWLKQTREGVEELKQDRKPVEMKSDYQDFRAVMHVHSHFSHDSRSSAAEVREGAQKAGVKIVMFNEHPADWYDYFTDGNRGLEGGVLFIPGAEQGGLLKYPLESIQKKPADSPQANVDLVRSTKGQTFLSHLEERMDWDLNGLTGTEIYNVHADFKDEAGFVKALRNPVQLLGLIPLIKQYPQETYAALQDYPADYLRRYDELCLKSRLTGVAANDAHHNQGMHAFIAEDGKIQLEDALKEKLAVLDPEKVILLKPLLIGKKPGDTVFRLDLDPYDRAFSHVTTHLMMKELSEAAVREALEAGRAYVSFDWLCDPTGFVYRAKQGDKVFEMGSEVPNANGVELEAEAPLPVRFRLMRSGKEVATTVGRTFKHTVTEPGNYRLEAWVNLPQEPKAWILSNPIYVR